MKNCLECNYAFTIKDRFKIIFTGKLSCKKCNTTYRIKNSIYRSIYYLIVYFSIIFASPIFTRYKGISLSFLTRVLILIFILNFFTIAYDLIPHKFQKYTKIK
ncbi:hypothetical protein IC213_19490 [Clostridioides sp. ES-S-0049-02]|uniref:hypothetical protein n=1 Tax=Clostridioides sp. ES-S-0049-02 TaxID=2770778 RepID=UPI001D118A5B|nr:hypothetical protein [Clostridioides sp. ES-S-0049-02]